MSVPPTGLTQSASASSASANDLPMFHHDIIRRAPGVSADSFLVNGICCICASADAENKYSVPPSCITVVALICGSQDSEENKTSKDEEKPRFFHPWEDLTTSPTKSIESLHLVNYTIAKTWDVPTPSTKSIECPLVNHTITHKSDVPTPIHEKVEHPLINTPPAHKSGVATPWWEKVEHSLINTPPAHKSDVVTPWWEKVEHAFGITTSAYKSDVPTPMIENVERLFINTPPAHKSDVPTPLPEIVKGPIVNSTPAHKSGRRYKAYPVRRREQPFSSAELARMRSIDSRPHVISKLDDVQIKSRPSTSLAGSQSPRPATLTGSYQFTPLSASTSYESLLSSSGYQSSDNQTDSNPDSDCFSTTETETSSGCYSMLTDMDPETSVTSGIRSSRLSAIRSSRLSPIRSSRRSPIRSSRLSPIRSPKSPPYSFSPRSSSSRSSNENTSNSTNTINCASECYLYLGTPYKFYTELSLMPTESQEAAKRAVAVTNEKPSFHFKYANLWLLEHLNESYEYDSDSESTEPSSQNTDHLYGDL